MSRVCTKSNPADYDIRSQKLPATGEGFYPPRMPNKLMEHVKKSCGKKDEDHNNYIIELGNVYCLKELIEAEKNTVTHRRSSDEGSHEFTGTKNMEESLDIAINGVEELNKEIAKQSKKMVLELKKEMQADHDIKRDVEGMYFDTGLYLSGEPEPFYQSNDTLIPDRCLDVHIMASYSASVEQEDMQEALVRIVAAVSVLELSGYRVAVHLWWLSITDCNYNGAMTYKLSKDYTQPFSIPRLVGAMHPGFFRRIIFRIRELFGADHEGYGTAMHIEYGRVDKVFYLDRMPETLEAIIEQIKMK